MKNIDLKTKKYILAVLAIIVLLLCIIILFNNRSDGMENRGILNVYYRTYTKENGWSKWSKNGLTSGNMKNDITKIEVKIKNKKGKVGYRIYNKNKWTKEYYSRDEMKNLVINGI